MGETKWKTIDAAKIEAEVDRIAAEIDALMPTAKRTEDIGLAVQLHGLTATHNALVAVLNSLS